MKAYRLALARYGGDARAVFSGLSGFSADGRWHASGRHLDYAAESRSLATLERLVHYKRFDHLEPHVLCVAEIPDDFIRELPRTPTGWDGQEPSPQAQALGNAWCDRRESPALRVPSAVMRGEFNLLLNSQHPQWSWDWVAGPVPFSFDRRLGELLREARRRSPGRS